MRSENRRQTTFDKLNVGDKFQLINNPMGAALPKSCIFRKVEEDEGINAIKLDEDLLVTIRSNHIVEIVA